MEFEKSNNWLNFDIDLDLVPGTGISVKDSLMLREAKIKAE